MYFVQTRASPMLAGPGSRRESPKERPLQFAGATISVRRVAKYPQISHNQSVTASRPASSHIKPCSDCLGVILADLQLLKPCDMILSDMAISSLQSRNCCVQDRSDVRASCRSVYFSTAAIASLRNSIADSQSLTILLL